MNESPTLPTTQQRRVLRVIVPVALVLALIGLIGGLLAWKFVVQPQPASQPVKSTTRGMDVPTNAAIEERWGIRVTQIGVTADGGLVDFRYIVLDPTKALDFAANSKTVPTLIVEGSGAQVTLAALMAHKQDLKPGRTYFLLYQNTRGAIKSGRTVSVVIGDLRLEHVPVL